jgi:hypothetical protein
MIFEEKKHLFKNFLFKWNGMKGHGHNCGYTGGGCIFWNQGMHAKYSETMIMEMWELWLYRWWTRIS